MNREQNRNNLFTAASAGLQMASVVLLLLKLPLFCLNAYIVVFRFVNIVVSLVLR